MSKGGGTQTVVQRPDPATQRYIAQVREQAQRAAQSLQSGGGLFTGPLRESDITAAMNPWLQSVVGATQSEFDRLRSLASTGTAQEATGAGAFGGSRQAVLEGTRLGELDRAQASQIANLMAQGYGQALQLAEHQRQLRERQLQEPLFRSQQALGLLNLGLGPVAFSSEQSGRAGVNPLGSAASGALTGASIGSIVPGIGTGIGALVGGGLGLLGGLFS